MNFFYDFHLGKDLFFGSFLYSKHRWYTIGDIILAYKTRLKDVLDRK